MSDIKCYDKYGIELDHLTQWDLNVSIKIPNWNYSLAPVCHFATRYSDTSVTVTSTLEDSEVTVKVPNVFLTDTETVLMYVFLYDPETDSGRTMYTVVFPIHKKKKPDDYEYVDNVEIVEISSLKAQFDVLVAEAEVAVHERINNLDNSYRDTILEIKNQIHNDVTSLNRDITANNQQLTSDITEARQALQNQITNSNNELNQQIASALNLLLNSIKDGSPESYFGDVSELVNKDAGFYLLIDENSENNGYIYYWDGTSLSERLLYYAGMVINDDTITFEMLSDNLKKKSVETIIPYTLLANGWINNTQELDVSEHYAVTQNTKADVDLTTTAYNQLLSDGCCGLFIATNENNDNKLVAHALRKHPTSDVAIQITLREVITI